MSVRFGDIPEVNNLKKLIGLYLLKLAYKYSDGIIANSLQGKKNVLDKLNIDNSNMKSSVSVSVLKTKSKIHLSLIKKFLYLLVILSAY